MIPIKRKPWIRISSQMPSTNTREWKNQQNDPPMDVSERNMDDDGFPLAYNMEWLE